MTNQQIRNASVPVLCDRLVRLNQWVRSIGSDRMLAYEKKLIETELLYRPIEDEFPDAMRDDDVHGGLGDFADEPSEYERLSV